MAALIAPPETVLHATTRECLSIGREMRRAAPWTVQPITLRSWVSTSVTVNESIPAGTATRLDWILSITVSIDTP